MLGKYRFVFAVALVVFAALPGCNTNIDDPKSAPVVMEVRNVQIPPITASLDATTGLCTVTLTNGTATVVDSPKNGEAITSPFNDIVLKGVTITYVWDDGLGNPGPVTYGVAGSVPANGTATAQFAFISQTDLSQAGGRFGHNAALVMTFFGSVVEGAPVSVTTGGTIVVGSCAAGG